MPGGVSHGKKHGIASIVDHKPVAGATENTIATFDANGLPVKDSGVEIGDIIGGLIPQGDWYASTNTPTLVNGTGTIGHFYTAVDAGTVNFGAGNITFAAGDYVVYVTGNIWIKQDNTQDVHAIGGAMHDADLLANFGSKLSDRGSNNALYVDVLGILRVETKGSAFNRNWGTLPLTNTPGIVGSLLGMDIAEIRDVSGITGLFGVLKNTAYNKDFGTGSDEVLEGNSIGEPKQAEGYYVSIDRGHLLSEGADGTLFNPFEDPDEAIQYGIVNGDDNIILIIDNRLSAGYTVTIPEDTVVSIRGSGSMDTGWGAWITCTLENNCRLSIDDMYINLIQETAGILIARIFIENCMIYDITGPEGVGYATKTRGIFGGSISDSATVLAQIDNMDSVTGQLLDYKFGVERIHLLSIMDCRAKRLLNIGAPIGVGDATNKNYVDTKSTNDIATHTAVADAHHEKYADWVGQQVYYVGKHGSDTNTGKSNKQSFLTFEKAITEVNAQTPSGSNHFSIVCLDSGQYTENLTFPSWCGVYAPEAELIGDHTMGDNCHVKFGILQTGTTTCISKTSGTGQSIVECVRLICTGTENGIECTSGELITDIQYGYVANGVMIDNSGAGDLLVKGNHWEVSGTGTIVESSSTGHVSCIVNKIEDTGTGGTGIKCSGTGDIDMVCSHLDCTTAYNISAGKVHGSFGHLEGTRTLTGTGDLRIVDPGSMVQPFGYDRLQTISASYVVFGRIVWRGAKYVGFPSAIKLLLQTSTPTKYAEARIYDVTNGNYIHSAAQTNSTVMALVDAGALSNISVDAAIWEVHVRRESGGSATGYSSGGLIEW